MALKQPTKRFLSLIAALCLIFASVVVFASFVRPVYGEARRMRGEVAGREQFLESQKAVFAQVEELRKAYRGEGELAQVASLALPVEKNESEIVYLINQLARFNKLTLQQVSIVPVGSGGGGGTRSGMVKPIGTLNVQMQVSGTYEDFKLFMRALETNIRIADLRSVGITPVGDSSQNFYTFELLVALYYQNPS